VEVVKEKLMEHDFAINAMVHSIQELSETTKDSNKKLGNIATSMGKQELILEKLTNLEGNTKSSIDRLHQRIDDMTESVKVCRTKVEDMEISNAKHVENIKSNKGRIDKIENSQTWVVRTIIGALIVGALTTIITIKG